jgi:hypothetical protein
MLVCGKEIWEVGQGGSLSRIDVKLVAAIAQRSFVKPRFTAATPSPDILRHKETWQWLLC